MPPLIYLGSRDVAACEISVAEVTAAVRDAFLASSRGQVVLGDALHLRLPNGTAFSAKGGLLTEQGVAAVKWYGIVPGNRQRGLADFNPLLMLNEVETGLTLAIIEGDWITAVRTAAISATAAGLLARPESASLGLIGSGRQAWAHFEVLRQQYPLRHLSIFSRNADTAGELATEAERHGLSTQVCTEARQAVAGHDIVVSTVPRRSKPIGFLDAGWLEPHAFAAMADLGYAWSADTLRSIDFLVSDELDETTGMSPEHLNFTGPFEASLASLLSGKRPIPAAGRSALIFAGTGLADVALAALVYRRAKEQGRGLQLER